MKRSAYFWVVLSVGALFGASCRDWTDDDTDRRREVLRETQENIDRLKRQKDALDREEARAREARKNFPVVETTPLELFRYFGENEVQAADWLKGKRVRIKAPVGTVSNNANGGDRVAVTLSSASRSSVDLWFDGPFRGQVGQLRKGQIVIVEGIFEKQSRKGDLTFEGLSIQ